MDIGLARLSAGLAGGKQVRDFLPPWYDVQADSDEAMLQTLFRLKEKFGKGE